METIGNLLLLVSLVFMTASITVEVKDKEGPESKTLERLAWWALGLGFIISFVFKS